MREMDDGGSEAEAAEGDLLPLDRVLELSGLNRQLLHAWERRYGLVPDRRTPTGRRFYSEAHAHRLRKLKLAVDAGGRISRLARLSIEDLDVLVSDLQQTQAFRTLIDAAQMLDTERLVTLLKVRLRGQGMRQWLFDTALPLLGLVGDLWETQKLPIAGEHIASQAMKRVILECLPDIQTPEGAPRAVVTTLEGESHEFGAAAAAILARLEGVDARYLGPTLPAAEIAAAASRLDARHVLISCIILKPEDALPQFVRLRQLLPDSISIIAGCRQSGALEAIEGVTVRARLADLPDLLKA